MSLKETIFSMMIEALELSEAAEVSGARYFGSHGKKPRDTGQPGSWMFTHKPSGDVDVNNEKEVHTVHGKKLSDAKKSAQQWAKEHGHSSVYVMEEVELDEEGHGVFLKGGSVGEKRSGKPVEVHKNIDDAKAQAKRLNKLLSPGEKQHYGLKYHVKPVTEGFVVELDEISKKTLGSYIKKAASDIGYAAAADDTNKELKRHKGIAKAANKLTKEEVELDELAIIKNNRKFSDVKRFDTDKETNAFLEKNPDHGVLHTDDGGTYVAKNKNKGATIKALNSLKKEEIQLDEISDEKKKDYIRAVADKGGMLRKPRPASLKGIEGTKVDSLAKAFKGGDMQDYAKLHNKSEKRAGIALKALNSLKKEEVELDEAKTDIYHKHMLKALGKTRLPKDHNYTSAIANNGDFVVHNAGRVVGRIPKDEHDLK